MRENKQQIDNISKALWSIEIKSSDYCFWIISKLNCEVELANINFGQMLNDLVKQDYHENIGAMYSKYVVKLKAKDKKTVPSRRNYNSSMAEI